VQADRGLHGSVVDRIPGAAALLAAAARPGWVRCRDAGALAAAVAGVRASQRTWWRARRGTGKQQRQQEDEEADAGDEEAVEEDGGGGDAKDWVPWVYDVMGTRSAEAAELLASARAGEGVWLLPSAGGGGGDSDESSSGSSEADGGAGSGSETGGDAAADARSGSVSSGSSVSSSSGGGGGGSGGAWDAVLVVAHSKEFRRLAAGALAASPAAAAACLAAAAARGPHFVAFVDQGARYWGTPTEGGDAGAWPEVYRLEGAAPTSSYYVFSKALAPRG
jgi:hypothetical protein